MRRIYKIYDWAGNDLTDHFGVFKTFDDAWDAIREYLADQKLDDKSYDDHLGEYWVDEHLFD